MRHRFFPRQETARRTPIRISVWELREGIKKILRKPDPVETRKRWIKEFKARRDLTN